MRDRDLFINFNLSKINAAVKDRIINNITRPVSKFQTRSFNAHRGCSSDGYDNNGTNLKKTNQLGGAYVNGKPLPKETRIRVLKLAQMGVRPCEISRQLRITHGCISKLLSKFQETGSIDPGNKNVGRPKVITPEIEIKIDQYREEQPGIFSWELKERLIRDKVCTTDNVPSLSSISRLIKSKIVSEANRKKIVYEERQVTKTEEKTYQGHSVYQWNSYCSSSSNSSSRSDSPPSDSSVKTPNLSSSTDSAFEAKRNPFSIANILGTNEEISSSNATVTNEESSNPIAPFEEHFAALNRSESCRRQRTKFTSHHLEELEKEFQMDAYPSMWRRAQIALRLEVEESRIQVWFSNRRSKGKRRGSLSSLHSLNETLEKHMIEQEHKFCPCRSYSAPMIMQGLPYTEGPSRLFFPPGYKD